MWSGQWYSYAVTADGRGGLRAQFMVWARGMGFLTVQNGEGDVVLEER